MFVEWALEHYSRKKKDPLPFLVKKLNEARQKWSTYDRSYM